MKRGDWITIALAVGLALIAAYIMFPDTVGEVVDSAVDSIVVLTTTEDYRLSQLESETEQQVRQLLANLQAQGLTVQVGQTLRTAAQEKTAIDSGHSGVKTASWHESGRAVDLYPINPDTLAPDYNGVRDMKVGKMPVSFF